MAERSVDGSKRERAAHPGWPDSSDGGRAGTQHLTALAAPEELVDWRLALCFEAAYSTGVLDELAVSAVPLTAEGIAEARGLDPSAVRAVLHLLANWEHVSIERGESDAAGAAYAPGPVALGPAERAALAQHGTWIRRWSARMPLRMHDRSAASPADPATPDPGTGSALLESAGQVFVHDVVDLCMEACAVARTPGRGTSVGESERLRVLDLGGGHGAYARELAARGCRVLLQDLPKVIELVHTDGRTEAVGVELLAADATRRVAQGPFDLVLSGTLTNLFDLAETRALVERIRGVLAPDGCVAIATWMRDRGPVGAAFDAQMLVATPSGSAHGENDYRRMLEAAGYSDIRLSEVGQARLGVLLARR